ncbi:MAG TPA: hypothetical protein VLT36_07260 [Candidatus Dormibacteraeota bacterium]|nr:hypothetical protein [Candidatus Dormibacteraeota bacterium]
MSGPFWSSPSVGNFRPLLISRIKLPGEQKIQFVHRHRKPRERVRHFTAPFFKSFCRAVESRTERELFIGIAGCAQECFDFTRPFESHPNAFPSLVRFHGTLHNALEQQTFELTAIARALGINPASTTVKSGTWLWNARRPVVFKGTARKHFQRRQVCGLQSHISKNHAIAAQSAGHAQVFGPESSGLVQLITAYDWLQAAAIRVPFPPFRAFTPSEAGSKFAHANLPP